MSTYDYAKISDYEKSVLPSGFSGDVYNLSYKWVGILPEYTKPIKIMEIGAYHGANVCSLVKTFAKHPDTQIHCVDPWIDYNDYEEYKGKQGTNYSKFLNNIAHLSPEDVAKIYIHRMSSAHLDTRFVDESFDVIYIDGNHTSKYVLQDAMLSLKKLVPGGYLIFDDVHDKDVVVGINMFLSIAKESVHEGIQLSGGQAFMKKR
jgi:hypothetical protein